MEEHDPSQRQYAPNPYAAQQSQSTGGQLSSQYGTPGSNERFRQTYLEQPPTAPQSAGRASNDAQQMYSFQQSAQYAALPALQTSAMSYAQNPPAQESQRSTQSQAYQQYGSSFMYGMGPPQPPQQQSASLYDQMPQYRQRSNAAPETLPSQFGVAQPGQYYLAGQAGPTSAPAPEPTAPQLSSQYQQPSYPQPGPTVPQAYPSAMIDPSPSGAYTSYTQQSQYGGQQQSAHAMDQAFNDYQNRIRTIFTLVRDGTLRDVGQHLVPVSQYLLGSSEALGLTRDDDQLHDDRIRLWDEFNRAWLTVMQRQFDMTEEMMQTGQPMREPQSIMSLQTLEQLSRELVRLCDQVEKHGLVDYQMGVSEEEIMDLILKCLSLLEPPVERTGEGAQTESSAAARGRGS